MQKVLRPKEVQKERNQGHHDQSLWGQMTKSLKDYDFKNLDFIQSVPHTQIN